MVTKAYKAQCEEEIKEIATRLTNKAKRTHFVEKIKGLYNDNMVTLKVDILRTVFNFKHFYIIYICI